MVETHHQYGTESVHTNEDSSAMLSDPYTLFVFALKSPVTRDRYSKRLRSFFASIPIEGDSLEEQCRKFVQKALSDNGWAVNSVMRFLMLQRERVSRKEITAATLRNYIKSIKLFTEMNELEIPWKKLTMGIPYGRRYADDRAPTLEEIRAVTDYPDRRIKAIVYTMASSGIRLGAWGYLKWGHISPEYDDRQYVAAAKVTVYPGEEEEYFTFISPEAYDALSDWMKYRQSAGEVITEDSWVMRNLWDTRVAQGRGLVSVPKQLSSAGIKRLMERALWAQGQRKKLENGKKRHPYQANHSLRKWFRTRCEIAGMKPINIETLMGHSTGISDSYYRPTERELLEDYLKAVPHLMINSESRTKMQLEELEQLKDKDVQTDDVIATLSDQVLKLAREIEELKRRS
jgi:hypothetical protein